MTERQHPLSNRGEEPRYEQRFKSVVQWGIFFAAAAFGAVFLYGAVSTIYYETWAVELAREHFAATVGLPFAALAALCLIILLEVTAGRIEVKGFGIEFKGASGPIIMWIFCFLAIASAIKLLW